MKKAILVAIDNNLDSINTSLEELNNLLNTIGIYEVDRLIQKLDKVNNNTFLGSGKLDLLKDLVIQEEVDYVVFDTELTPKMLFNISKVIDCNILDRTSVILKIFKLNATSELSKLEIELARLKYELPRIEYLHKFDSFDRQGGGLNSKGSGETQTELDKRILSNKIISVSRKIDEIKKRKISETVKKSNSNIKNIALVGYTNAGKSSTMNSLVEYLNKYEYKNNVSKKLVESEDKLFKTLSTTSKLLTYKNVPFYLSDTIGFINKLPHELINSFLTTLLEARNADLLIIVLDVSSKNLGIEYQTTLKTLRSLNIIDKPILLLLNKVDKLDIESIRVDANMDSLLYSNKDSKYQKELLEYIYNYITKDYTILDLSIPYTSAKTINKIENNCHIISKTYLDNYVLYKINCPNYLLDELSLYKFSDIIN